MNELVAAADRGDLEGIKKHINLGVNSVAHNNWSPLLLCVEKRSIECIKFLLQHDANPDQIGGQNRRSPLHIAAFRKYADVVALLVHHGADVNVTNEKMETPLHTAAEVGDIECARQLLKGNPDLSLRDSQNRTAFDIAMTKSCTELAELINPSSEAAPTSNPVEALFSPPPSSATISLVSSPKTANMLVAAQHGMLDKVQQLLADGQSVNVVSGKGWTPLLLAVEGKHTDIVKLLLEAKADIHGLCGASVKKSALHLSAFNGDVATTQLLLKFNANANLKGSDGSTPLHSLAVSSSKKVEIAVLLLQHGCCVSERNHAGKTAEELAVGTPLGAFLAPQLPPLAPCPTGLPPYRCPSYPQSAKPPCHLGAVCEDKSPEHEAQFTHRCYYAFECRMLQRGDPQHIPHYTHHPVDDVKQLTPEERLQLKLPLGLQLKREFTRGICQRVLVNGFVGYFIGWERDGFPDKTDKCLVWVEGKLSLHPMSAMIDLGEPIHPPWFRSSLHVFQSSQVAVLLQSVLAKPVEGLKGTTFLNVFHELHQRGIFVFIMGGAVRDAVVGVTTIKDIDMAFGCTAKELKAIAQEKGWSVWVNSQALVQLGDTSQALFLEGKSIVGYNCDLLPLPSEPACWSSDLAYEAICKDFTCNTLFYDPDPANCTIIDPTGCGVWDTQHRLIRITVDRSHWDQWFSGNPSKLVRYWKMRLKGYSPADDATRQYIIAKAHEQFGVHERLTRYWTNLYINRMVPKKKQGEFRQLVAEDMGVAFQQKWFPDPAAAAPA